MLNRILWLEKHGNKWEMEDLGAIILHWILMTRNKIVFPCVRSFKTENCSHVNVVRIFGITYF